MVVMLTKENCPRCVNLKNYLKMGLRDKYVNDIKIVKLEEDEENFMSYVKKHNLTQMPVLIADNDVLLDISPSKVSAFLKKHLDK